MQSMWEKYGGRVMTEVIDSLVGTCQLGTPELEWYGIAHEDIDEVIDSIEEYVYECASCGWYCDGGDRHSSEDADGDVCEQCHEEEMYDGE